MLLIIVNVIAAAVCLLLAALCYYLISDYRTTKKIMSKHPKIGKPSIKYPFDEADCYE